VATAIDPSPRPLQRTLLVVSAVVVAVVFFMVSEFGPRKAALFAIGLGLGMALYHAAFGFTGAYRRAVVERDMSGISAQLVMLAVAMLLFAPVLIQGSVFGRDISGAVAPVSVSMAFGAFVFGIGMQLGGGCASGTLFTVGGGSVRMMVVLAFFCIGAFWGSLDLGWWQTLPELGAVSLGHRLGWGIAIPLQLAVLAAIYFGLRRLGARDRRPLWWPDGFAWRSLLRGPWPLLISALILALLNWATLLVAGHAWSITWAFSLWSAKVAMAAGWDPATSDFWRGAFQQRALARSVFADTTSVMNFGIVLGALVAASLAGKASAGGRLSMQALGSAVVGGLMMGYGARLAYGCNIGAFFSGVASTSLHGWVWILCAIPGNLIGIRLHRFFRL
jgi:uncharacterized protein